MSLVCADCVYGDGLAVVANESFGWSGSNRFPLISSYGITCPVELFTTAEALASSSFFSFKQIEEEERGRKEVLLLKIIFYSSLRFIFWPGIPIHLTMLVSDAAGVDLPIPPLVS